RNSAAHRAHSDSYGIEIRSDFLYLARVLIGEPASTSPEHALARRRPVGRRQCVSRPTREVLLRQHLALLNGRLIERIDADELRGDDRLQHEMHHQLAESWLVEPVEMQGAHRTAV